MNKVLILITVGLIILSVCGCKSFRKYFNPPPNEARIAKIKNAQATKKAKLTPAQQRKRQLEQATFGLSPKNEPKKTFLNSSLNSYERQYINRQYEKESHTKKRNVFKLF